MRLAAERDTSLLGLQNYSPTQNFVLQGLDNLLFPYRSIKEQLLGLGQLLGS